MLNILNDCMSDTFLPERMKVAKCNKLLCNLYDKEIAKSLYLYEY